MKALAWQLERPFAADEVMVHQVRNTHDHATIQSSPSGVQTSDTHCHWTRSFWMWLRPTTWRAVSCTMRRRGGPSPTPRTGTTCSRYARRPTFGVLSYDVGRPSNGSIDTPYIIQLGYDMERLCYPAWFEALGRKAGLAYRDVFPSKVSRGTDRGERAWTVYTIITHWRHPPSKNRSSSQESPWGRPPRLWCGRRGSPPAARWWAGRRTASRKHGRGRRDVDDVTWALRDAELFTSPTHPYSAFIASGASERGQAVSSLGSTLAIKMLSATPVEDASRGVYRYDLPFSIRIASLLKRSTDPAV